MPLPCEICETENCLYTAASDEGLMETMFPCPIRNQILRIKNFRGRKEMTSKKSKTNSITHKTDSKYRLKEVQKKNQSPNKRIETFLPISNEETPKK